MSVECNKFILVEHPESMTYYWRKEFGIQFYVNFEY